ncbi:putative ribonuclease H-like domain-containing protein [Tanacetum coccineum]
MSTTVLPATKESNTSFLQDQSLSVSTILAPLQLTLHGFFLVLHPSEAMNPQVLYSLWLQMTLAGLLGFLFWGLRDVEGIHNARTSQQNEVAERKNRTLIEAARTMLADSKLPTMFWTEAASTTNNEAHTTAREHLSQADLATSRNGVPAGKIDFAADVSDGHSETSTPVCTTVHTAATSLPPGHSLGSSVHSTRYPSPSDLANFLFPTKRVTLFILQSQILGDLTSTDYDGSHGDRKSTTVDVQFWAICCGQVLKIYTDANVADLLTKAFDEPSASSGEAALSNPQTVPKTITKPDHSHDHESTPPKPTTSNSGAPVNEPGPSSDPNIASSSRPHESAPDQFTSTNVEDETMGGSFQTLPPRSTQAPPKGTTSGGAEDLEKLTALSTLVSTLVQKVNTQESELNAHKLLFKEEEDAVQDEGPLSSWLRQLLQLLLLQLFLLVVLMKLISPSSYVPTDEFAGGSDVPAVALLGPSADPSNKRNSPFDKRNKPMTYAQQKAYMRTFVKNQSSTIYTTGWTMKHVKSFSDDQLKTKFDKIRTAAAELQSLNIKRSLKRPGADLEQASSKKSKSTEAPKSDVPADSQQPSVEVPSQKATIEDVEAPSNIASIAQHTGSSPKKVGTRKKRDRSRKGVHAISLYIPLIDEDPEAEPKCRHSKHASD